jgi:DNA-binding transcriptional MerR regulator
MLIGELADALGLPTQTVRFYERRGLLPDPRRAPNGYRVYDEATLGRLRFIRSAQTAGLTLAEICSIIDIRDRGTAPCTHVDALLDSKLDEVRERRQQLAALEHDLEQLVERSRRLDPSDCSEGDICQILQTEIGKR